MTPLWLLTVVTWLVAVPVLWVLARRALHEAQGLSDSVRDHGELRPALLQVRTDTEEIRRRLAARSRR